MPFGRSLAPSMLHRHDGHAEAVARIGWCIDQHALGVITGEVGAGKTVAVRAATGRAGHLPARGDLPAQPLRRGPRHAAPHRRHARAGAQLLHRNPGPAGRRRVGRRARRTRPDPDRGLRRGAPAGQRPAGSRPHAHQPRDGLRCPVRGAPGRSAHPAAPAAPRCARRARPADLRPLRPGRHDRDRDRGLHHPPPAKSPAGATPCSAPTPSP